MELWTWISCKCIWRYAYWYHKWDTRPSRCYFIFCYGRGKNDPMNDLLDRFNPSFTTKCSIKSLLTFVVQIIFSEMRIDATGMLLQLEFDYRFSRTVKEWLKRQCFIPFAFVTVPKSQQQITRIYPSCAPSKGRQTIWRTSEWNEELESNVWSGGPPENSAKHDN